MKTNTRAKMAAESIIRCYQDVVKLGEREYPGNTTKQSWYLLHTKQAYTNSLRALCHVKLIKDYNLVTGEVT